MPVPDPPTTSFRNLNMLNRNRDRNRRAVAEGGRGR